VEAQLNEENILEVKALVMGKTVFKQCRMVTQKEYEVSRPASDLNPMVTDNWLGYVVESQNTSVGETQTIWFLFESDDTICRIRDAELFWILRAETDVKLKLVDMTVVLRRKLQQIFIK